MRISEVKITDIANHIKKIIILIGGQTTQSEAEFNYTVTAYKQIFANYTMQEIEYAIELVLKGTINYDLRLYDKPFSVSFIGGLMQKYVDWRRTEADYQKAKQNDDDQKTPEQIYHQMKTASLRAFEKYKKGDDEECRFYIYNWLYKNGFINPTQELWDKYYEEAKYELEKDLALEQSRYRRNKNDMKNIIEIFNNNNKRVDKTKEIALKEYFNDLIQSNINLKI